MHEEQGGRSASWVSPGCFLEDSPGDEQSRNETMKRSSILN